MPARILIATPTAFGDLYVEYCEAIGRLMEHFAAARPDVELVTRFIETYDLRLVRNVYASMVLNDPTFTHLLFVDSDMGFFPSLLERMLDSARPVVGVVSPARSLDPKAVHEMARRFNNLKVAEVVANKYIPEGGAFKRAVNPENREEVVAVVHDNMFAPVVRIGTGIVLIHRSVFETFRDRLPDLYDAEAPPAARRHGLTGGYIRPFDGYIGPRGNSLGEDYAFSRRWTNECGGELVVILDEFIFHVGGRPTLGNPAVRYEYRKRGLIS